MSGSELFFEKVLGEGSFGSVSLFSYKGGLDGRKMYFAVKASREKDGESLLKEFRMLCGFRGCSGIIQCFGRRVEKRINDEGDVEYMLNMEYAAGGSLTNFINQFQDKKLPDSLIRDFTRMILQGLAVIHERGYVHCDIKPENILVFPSCDGKNGAPELKITDFGLSVKEGDHSWWSVRRRFVGTPIYMSPESVSHGETGKALDLWSLGCVVLEMYTGKKPWWHTNYDLKYLKKCYEPLIPRDLPDDANHFITTCFSLEPEGRKDASTLLRHSFLHEDVVDHPLASGPSPTTKLLLPCAGLYEKWCTSLPLQNHFQALESQ